MNEFRAEMAGLSTEDLILVYTDQKNLYSEDELLVIESELLSRTEITGKKPYGGSTAWTPEMLVRMSVRRTLS